MEDSILRRTAWEKGSKALVELYCAFYVYLDFMRGRFNFNQRGGDVTPMHDFRKACDSLSVFLTDDLKTRVDRDADKLLQFWNWTVENRDTHQEEIRRRLDYEIPGFFDRLRIDIGRYLGEVPATTDEIDN